jgi:hypothetical protein
MNKKKKKRPKKREVKTSNISKENREKKHLIFARE